MASAPAAPASGAASATTTPPTATATATVEPTLIGTEESESSDSSASDNDDGSSSTAQQQHQDAPRAGRAMPEGLSKSGQRKWELIEQRRLLRKDKRRERKERRKRKRDAAHRDSTTADAAAAQHTQPPSAKRRRVIEIAPDAQRIVIDCNWCDVMTPKELTAMVQQIVHSYAVNSRADVPCNLTVSSFCGAIKQDIDYSHPSHTNWKGVRGYCTHSVATFECVFVRVSLALTDVQCVGVPCADNARRAQLPGPVPQGRARVSDGRLTAYALGSARKVQSLCDRRLGRPQPPQGTYLGLTRARGWFMHSARVVLIRPPLCA